MRTDLRLANENFNHNKVQLAFGLSSVWVSGHPATGILEAKTHSTCTGLQTSWKICPTVSWAQLVWTQAGLGVAKQHKTTHQITLLFFVFSHHQIPLYHITIVLLSPLIFLSTMIFLLRSNDLLASPEGIAVARSRGGEISSPAGGAGEMLRSRRRLSTTVIILSSCSSQEVY